MTNALDVAKEALRLWRNVRGNESTYLQCQRYDGYYWQWAYQGNETGITAYPSAIAAARSSSIFTKDVNHPSIEPGDQIFWNWGKYGHVATVIGRDGGRVLVTHTSHSGDNLGDLGLNVRISHADTISLDVYGVSKANGRNRRRSGLSGYNIGGGSPAPQPAPGGSQIDLRDGWAWYNSAAEAEQERNPHGPKWTGEQLARGVYTVLQAPNAVQIRANDGSSIWISPKARGRISGGAPAPAPAPAPLPADHPSNHLWWDVPSEGQYYYNQLNNALNGNFDRNQLIPASAGTLHVVELSGQGPIKVNWNGKHVWVGTRRNPAHARRG